MLPMQQPFPTFVQVRSRLLLEEIGLNEAKREEGATTLVIAGNNSSSGGDRSGD